MVNNQHKVTPEQVFGARLREARKRKGWTQAQVAARLAELGYPLDRTMIAKLERGRTKLTALRNLFALSLALDVAPINLIVPLEDDLDVPLEIVPGLAVAAPVARAWIRGLWGLPPVGKFAGTEIETFLAESAVSELRGRVRQALRQRSPTTSAPPTTLAALIGGTVAYEPAPELVDAVVAWIRREQEQPTKEGDDDGK